MAGPTRKLYKIGNNSVLSLDPRDTPHDPDVTARLLLTLYHQVAADHSAEELRKYAEGGSVGSGSDVGSGGGSYSGSVGSKVWVGLADNGDTPFKCGTCKFFANGICKNEHPKLYGRKVEARWCCNLFFRKGMRLVIDDDNVPAGVE